MTIFRKLFSRDAAQSAPIDPRQTLNSAGGYVWAVDDWVRLDRFLILGTEGGSFYASEQALSVESAAAVARCLDADGARAVARIVAVSQAGRAPKNDPALFALAMAAGLGSPATRKAALAALPQVARTGTHLFHFLAYVEQFRGWGRSLREAVSAWYNDRAPQDLAFQAVKYRQRDGWTHRDALRLAHPQAASAQHQAIMHWMVKGWPEVGAEPHPDQALRMIWAFERAQRATSAAEIVRLIREERLPREAIPTAYLGDALVWEALLEHMPIEAMVRNLATMSRVGLLVAGSTAARTVAARLRERERIRRARLHPIKLLAALATYASGKGVRGGGEWTPVGQVIDALDAAFYLAFENVEPTGKRMLLALDVSGSMSMGAVAGVAGLTPRNASAAMALVTAATEPNYQVMGFGTQFVKLAITPRQRLDDAVKVVSGLPFSGTDCGLPMLWALEHKVKVDAFVVYTDSETWAGKVHPTEALRRYREATGIAAKLVVVGMLANKFSIADPADAGMLDCVGFSTDTPQVIADFVRG
jgi:60 kDa SS-A/Ro ribonucleoprotein